MASRIVQRLTLAAVLAGAMGLVLVPAATADRLPGARPARPRAARGFNLFAGAPGLTISANRVQCGMNNTGEQCVNATDSPTLGGGYWPKGSPNQYVFNGGFQLAGIIPGNRANFPWSGDTVGVFFFDASGYVKEGDAVENMYMSTVKDDIDNWPSAAYVNDPTLYDASLLGRKAMSQEDTWTRYWDGNLNLTGGRVHAMGVLVDQRTMAWNFPTGNQDIFYVVMRFINITSTLPARYAGLAAYGYSPADITEIVRLAQVFHDGVREKYGVTIPDTGYQFTRVYAGPGEDPDVDPVAATANYSSANLPFSMDFAWVSAFNVNGWSYPSDIFYGPWARVPGFHGLKFLKGPANAQGDQIGITMFTNTDRLRGLGDRQTTQSLWRLAANAMLPVDGQCNVPVNTPLCFVGDMPSDTRMYMFSGPLTINPGESQVVVTAGIFAAAYGPGFVNGNGDGLGHTLGSTSFDVRPGFPGTVTGYVSADSRTGQTGLDTLRLVDRLTGWNSTGPYVNTLDVNGNGRLEQSEIPVIPGSLLGKALVAQAVFDAHFLLPYAPESPNFFLIPGDNQVTVVWQPSVTEQVGSGDPYFAVASDPANPLYDPNYRANDVEGYRIWRGRTQADMRMLAQFDYAGTSMTDYTGQFTNSDYGSQCAPELFITASCPDFPHAVALAGDVLQVRKGDRAELASGDVIVNKADTAVTGGNSGMQALRDTGVPFVYVDNEARDGFLYFYAVTAFDVNSVASGPTSLQSSQATKRVVPRAAASNPITAPAYTIRMIGDDGSTLDPSAPWPAIDAATGTFNGIIPPGNGGDLSFLYSVPAVLPLGSWTVKIDSLSPGMAAGFGLATPTLYLTFDGGDAQHRWHISHPLENPAYNAARTTATAYGLSNPLVPVDSAAVVRLGSTFSRDLRLPVRFSGVTWPAAATSMGAAVAFARYGVAGLNQATRFLMHSYWYNEGGAQPADPTIQPYGSAANTNGALTGVTTIYSPIVYRVPISGGGAGRAINAYVRGYSTNPNWYPADFVVTWGNGGAITVRDSTHRITLPFKRAAQIGWGFLDTTNISAAAEGDGSLMSDGSAGVTFSTGVISYYSLYSVDRMCQDYWGMPCADLAPTARLLPIDYTNDGVADGSGIALIINGEPFYMLMNSLPAPGTKWHLKAVGGGVMTATCTPALPTGTGTPTLANQPTDCSGYTFTPLATRPVFAPGVRYQVTVTSKQTVDQASGDISRIHTVPDPYYVTNQLELTSSTKVLRFVNLPNQAIIRIYSVSGVLVNILTHNDAAGGGEEVWNLRNRNNQFVASGVYFYHVETRDGRTKIGRFTVVNYAQ